MDAGYIGSKQRQTDGRPAKLFPRQEIFGRSALLPGFTPIYPSTQPDPDNDKDISDAF